MPIEASQILTALQASWSHMQPPSVLTALPKDLEALGIEKWLQDLGYDSLRKTHQLHSELPFLFLEPEASAYYIAGYMKFIVEEIEHGGAAAMDCGIPFIHLSAFLESSSGFKTCRRFLSADQIKTVEDFTLYLQQHGLNTASV